MEAKNEELNNITDEDLGNIWVPHPERLWATATIKAQGYEFVTVQIHGEEELKEFKLSQTRIVSQHPCCVANCFLRPPPRFFTFRKLFIASHDFYIKLN